MYRFHPRSGDWDEPLARITWQNETAFICSVFDVTTISQLASGELSRQRFCWKNYGAAVKIADLLNKEDEPHAIAVRLVEGRECLYVDLVDTTSGEINTILLTPRSKFFRQVAAWYLAPGDHLA